MITIGQTWYTLEECIKALRELIRKSEGYGFQPLPPTDVKLIYRNPITAVVKDDSQPSGKTIMIHINTCKIYSAEPDIEQSIPYLNKYLLQLPEETVVIG